MGWLKVRQRLRIDVGKPEHHFRAVGIVGRSCRVDVQGRPRVAHAHMHRFGDR